CHAVVGGQAFHWFDLDRALARFEQVLLPGGIVVAFWNLRSRVDPFNQAYEALLRRHCSDYVSVGAEPRARAILQRYADREQACFPHRQVLDAAGLRGRLWSSSYVRHGVTDAEAFDADVDALFAAHERDGTVTLLYDTHAAVLLTRPRGEPPR
ncbi:MAG: SAM-dependent methyltransferase, partial [Myxococcota bacterium]